MKIVYCIDSLKNSGGTERVLTTKVNYLAEQHAGYGVYVVTLKENNAPFFKLSDNVHRVQLDIDKGNLQKYHDALSSLLDEIRPDVTVCVAGMAETILPLIKDGSSKILEFHYTKNFLVNFVKGIRNIRFKKLHLLRMRWLQWRLKQTAKKYDCFVGLTKMDVDLWRNPKNMTFVHNPLSFRSVRKSSCLNQVIISVGSWTPAKGMDQLLEAFGPLAKEFPDWRIELYGSGQDEQLLRDIIAKYSMENQVSLNAPVNNIAEKLTEASIYAFPSRSDGFGLVITEAMECGLPTVAMDCPCGPCEIVTPATGIVVPEKDILAFRKALKELMTNADKRMDMGKSASIEVSRFYPEIIMPKWIELFKKVKSSANNN